jgi:hypothetical protein
VVREAFVVREPAAAEILRGRRKRVRSIGEAAVEPGVRGLSGLADGNALVACGRSQRRQHCGDALARLLYQFGPAIGRGVRSDHDEYLGGLRGA